MKWKVVSVSHTVLYFQIWGAVTDLDDLLTEERQCDIERASSVVNENKCLMPQLSLCYILHHISQVFIIYLAYFATYFSVFVCCWERGVLCTQLDFIALDT